MKMGAMDDDGLGRGNHYTPIDAGIKKQEENKMEEGKPKPLESQGKVEVTSKPVYIGIGLEGENLLYYGLGEKFSELVANKLDEQDALKDFAKYENIMGKCLLGWYDDSFGMEITFESKLISKVPEPP